MSALQLTYICDQCPGYRREVFRSKFRYRTHDGDVIESEEVLTRIRSLAIPPAWQEVWICPEPFGHLQATGRDARGRKQYRYHPEYRQAREGEKFSSLVAFGQALPRLRAVVEADLNRSGLPREKVLAAVVRLLDVTHLRVGNLEYVRANGSYGLSTLQDNHVKIDGPHLRLRFRGKSGVWHDRRVSDRRLARVVAHCRALPGQELFQYLDDDNQPRTVTSTDVNQYLREACGGEFTAKVFRTWAGTVAAAIRLDDREFTTKTRAKREIVDVIREVSERLGNTVAVCRKSYIHPRVLESVAAGKFRLPRIRKVREGLSHDEARVLSWLAATR